MRNLCCKCPHFYDSQDYVSGEWDWGCRVFGSECKNCPSFWDNEGDADFEEQGCNVHPKKLEFLLMRANQKLETWIKEDYKSDRRVKHYTEPTRTEKGYKAIRKSDGLWMGFYTNEFRPNMKGGHCHNYLRNALERKLNKSKSSRKRCHNVLNKGYEYRFNGQRLTRVK